MNTPELAAREFARIESREAELAALILRRLEADHPGGPTSELEDEAAVTAALAHTILHRSMREFYTSTSEVPWQDLITRSITLIHRVTAPKDSTP